MLRFCIAMLLAAIAAQGGFKKAVAGGSQFFLLLQDDGAVLAFGESEQGNVGYAERGILRRPKPIVLPGEAVDIAAGLCSSYAVLADGTVYSWGCNGEGMLGRGLPKGVNSAHIPGPVAGLPKVQSIQATNDTVGVVTADGELWMWGVLYSDRKGLTVRTAAPQRVEGLPPVASFSVNNRDLPGVNHMFAVGRDGSLWAWGFGEHGRLGLGNTESTPVPKRVNLPRVVSAAVGGNNGVAVLADGTVRVWGNNDSSTMGNGRNEQGSVNPNPVPVAGIAGAASVTAGHGHIIVLMKNGTMRTWGHDGWGQAGIGTSGGYQDRPVAPKLTGVTAAFATRNRCFAITTGGRLWFWGPGYYKLPGVMGADKHAPVDITALW